MFSAGAIATTVGGLARWNVSLDGERLLNADSKEQMWTPAKLTNGKATKYGFGWFLDTVEGHRNIGHGGSTSGFSASMQRFPDENLAVIILSRTPGQGGIATTLAKKIATFLLQEARRRKTLEKIVSFSACTLVAWFAILSTSGCLGLGLLAQRPLRDPPSRS